VPDHTLRSTARRCAVPHIRDTSAASAAQLAKTLSAIKRRRKARHLALRAATRDEDEISVAGKGKGRASAAVEQCPVCMQDIGGDLDVVAAHIDACLAHAELSRPGGSTDGNADGGALLDIDDHAEGDDDLWEEGETLNDVRRLRLRAGIRSGASALGFAVGDRTVEDVEDEIDVEGDDLGAFGAAQFTEADVRAEGSDPKLSGRNTGLCVAEVETDLAIERARRSGDSQALILALESKIRLLMVRQRLTWGQCYLFIQLSGHVVRRYSGRVPHLSRAVQRADGEHRLLARLLPCMLATLSECYRSMSNLQTDHRGERASSYLSVTIAKNFQPFRIVYHVMMRTRAIQGRRRALASQKLV
jgi:E3 ubiquitin-protein ligase RNF220